MIKLLLDLWSHFDQSRKNSFFLLLGVMVAASLIEIFSIGSVIPFLAALTNPEQVFYYKNLDNIFISLGMNRPKEIVLPITALFIFLSILACFIRLVLLRLNSRFVFNIGKFLGINVFNKIINQPFELHITRNSSEILSLLSVKINSVIYSNIMTSINIISSSIMLLFIISGLLYINIELTFYSGLFFGIFYIIAISISRKILYNNSKIINKATTNLLKSIQEGLGGIRDILLDGRQDSFSKRFRVDDERLRAAQSINTFISVSPRYIIEGIGVVVIATTAYILSDGNNYEAIPMLGVLALSAQKILPLFQQIYSSLTEFKGNIKSLIEVLNILNYESRIFQTPSTFKSRIDFNEEIVFFDAKYSYPASTTNILNKINVNIRKGDRIGIIGETGSGKSTFLDILMGLLNLTEGNLIVDQTRINSENCKSWQDRISHVPQSIYLFDGSIAENIAFGVDREKINFERIQMVCKICLLEDVIENLPHKYDSLVGERGVNLSGGQAQRIGIARALYKNADVIIFDEATSALDESTETKIMKNIYCLGKQITLIIVSHRPSTLKQCNRIFSFERGGIIVKDNIF